MTPSPPRQLIVLISAALMYGAMFGVVLVQTGALKLVN